MRTGVVRIRRSLLLAVALTLIAVPAADALYVKGHQTAVGGPKYEMTGGLVGKWKITKFHPQFQHGQLFKAKGQEKFNGCVDLARDGSCAGDPTGKLWFKFRYWAQLAGQGEDVALGACAHRIFASSGGLTGTTGFLMMVDTPVKGGLKTHYEGDINVPGFARAGAGEAPSC
jgi:hypothetical protein